MSDLAFNINGESFEVPAQATGWRVRRMRAKGAPEVVYGRDGTPLVLPIDADLDDLRSEVDVTGRYRLDLVDHHNKAIADMPSGYVQINTNPPPAAPAASTSLGAPSDSIVIEAMRMNAELARSVIERFPMMMEAAATLLRAADGAGLPAREPRLEVATEDEADDVDTTAEAKPGSELFMTLAAQLVPQIVNGLVSKKMNLASALDWRKAGTESAPPKPKKAATPDATSAHEQTTEADDVGLPPIDPATMMHFVSIQSVLDPAEAELAREVASNLSPAELRSWFDELKKLNVPQAVQKIRVLIAGNTEAVS